MTSQSTPGDSKSGYSSESDTPDGKGRHRAAAVRLVMVISALALAVLGQALLITGHGLWAITPYVVAVIAMTTAVTNTPFNAGSSALPQGDGSTRILQAIGRRERRWAIVCMLLAMALMASSLYLFPKGPPNALAWWFFGLSVPLATVSVLAFDGRVSSFLQEFRADKEIAFVPRSSLLWLGLLAILILAAVLRLYNLDGLPAGLWFDEADNVRHAVEIRTNPGATAIFVPSTNLPSLFLMPIALVVELAGVSITTARLVSVTFGLAGIAAMFLLVRFMLGAPAALVAAFVTAVMRWDINWSRIGMHGITAPLFAALTAYLTLRAVRFGRHSDFALAGGAMGLGMWFYASFRLFPLVIGLLFLHALLVSDGRRRRLLANAVIMGLAAIFVAAPVVQSAVVDTEDFFARTGTTSVFSVLPLDEALDQMQTSMGKHLAMFHLKGDPNPRHNLPGEPMLDFLSGALLILGAAIAFTRWRNASLIIMPFWIILMLLPGVITLPWEAPQSLRAITVIPAVVALIALAVGAIWVAGREAPWPIVRKYTPVFVAVLMAVIAFANVNTYFGRQASHPDVYASFSTDETLMARDMQLQQRLGYSLMVSRQFLYSLTASLLAGNPRFDTISAPYNIPLDPEQVWRGAAIYLEPREAGFYHLLKAFYPDAEFREVRPPAGGDALFYSASISRSLLKRDVGLIERRTYSDGSLGEFTKLEAVSVWALEATQDQVPFDMEWEGALHITRAGEYSLALDGNTDAQVFLDDRPILSSDLPTAQIRPAVGLHTLRVQGRVEDRSEILRLLWRPPGRDLMPIPAAHLYHGAIRPMGLAGRFYQGDEEVAGVLADALRVTPVTDAFWYDPVLTEPYFAVWQGNLDVRQGGVYDFSLEAFGDLKLYIDGAVVADSRGESESQVTLLEGPRRIRLEYFSEFSPSEFEVRWAPPGQSLGPIPIESLTPDKQQMFDIIGN